MILPPLFEWSEKGVRTPDLALILAGSPLAGGASR